MKRQRGGANNVKNNSNGVGVSCSSMNLPKVEDMAVVGGAALGKKRSKKEAEQNNNNKVVGSSSNNTSLVVEEEEEIRNKESKEVVVGAGDHQEHHNQNQSGVMGWNSWEEYMPWGVDDEQMSWGTTWFPGWDMDFMGEAFSALYSDVVWDDDIWNLRKEIPIPFGYKQQY